MITGTTGTTWTTMSSPVGELLLETDDDHLTAIRFEPWGDVDGRRDDTHPVLIDTRTQLLAYFAGERESFDLPITTGGTEFQQRVWDRLCQIPYGSTTSYGEIARSLGMPPGASRAVGLANGRNPIPIVVPCHRVVGSNGSLTGYGGGLDRKQVLLRLESAALF